MTFIANQELTKKQLDLLTDNVVELVSVNEGKLLKKEYWGLKNFAYPIKKQKRGYYVMLGIEASQKVLDAIEKKLKNQEEVLKHFYVKVEKIAPELSQLAKSDNE